MCKSLLSSLFRFGGDVDVVRTSLVLVTTFNEASEGGSEPVPIEIVIDDSRVLRISFSSLSFEWPLLLLTKL